MGHHTRRDTVLFPWLMFGAAFVLGLAVAACKQRIDASAPPPKPAGDTSAGAPGAKPQPPSQPTQAISVPVPVQVPTQPTSTPAQDTPTPGNTHGLPVVTEESIREIASPSPNKSARTTSIKRIVLHNTESTLASALATLRSPAGANRVSAHILVGRDGALHRIVPDADKAWHATVANDDGLGLEIEAGKFGRGMTPLQEATVIAVVRRWMRLHKVTAQNITMHRLAAPGTTDCATFIWPEGNDKAFFNWRRDRFGS